MFPSSGYFRSINCPFYDSGLCERPSCQFRHVRKEEQLISSLASTSGGLNIGNVGTSIEQLVSEAVKRVISENNQLISQLDVNRFQQVLQTTVTNSASALVERLNPTVSQKKYSIPADVPSYKPTPIKLLEQAKAAAAPTVGDAYSPTIKTNSRPTYKPTYSEYEPKPVSTSWAEKSQEEFEPKFSSDEEDDTKDVEKNAAQPKIDEYKPGVTTPISSEYDPVGPGISSKTIYQPGETKKSTESYVPAYSENLTFNLNYKPTKRTDKDLDYKPSKRSEKIGYNNDSASKYEPLKKQSSYSNEKEYVPSVVKTEQEYVPVSQKLTPGVTSPERTLEQLESDSEVSSTTADNKKEVDLSAGEAAVKDTKKNDERQKVKDHEELRKSRPKEKHRKQEKSLSKERKHDSKKAKKKDRSRSRSKERRTSKESKKVSSKYKKKHHRSRSREKSDRKRSRSRDRKRHDSKSGKSDSKNCERDKDRKSSKEKKCEKREEKHSQIAKRSESRESARHESKEKARKESVHNGRKEDKPRRHERKESASEKEQKRKEEKESDRGDRERKDSQSSLDDNLGQSEFEPPTTEEPAVMGEEDDYFPDLSMLEELDDIFEDLGEEDLNNEALMEECYKIFQDYKPETAVGATESQKKAKVHEVIPTSEESAPSGKKRMAHSGQNPVVPREQPAPKMAKMSPAGMMQERLRLMKELYMLRKQAAQARMDVQVSSTVSSTSGPSTSTGQGNTQANKKRIAHVPNVQGLLKKPGQSLPVVNKPVVTRVGQTNEKGTARTAHIPTEAVLERPMVAPDSSNKVPVSVRQRYLNIIIDHLLNTGIPEKDAYEQALDEEKSAYNRSGTKSVYLNAVVSAINRLKKAAETVKSGGGPAGGQKVSHLQVLTGKPGAKGSWSIEKVKKNPDVLTGSLLYRLLEKYILKFEELESNGFPIPDPAEKGRAKMVVSTFRKKVELPPLSSPYERRCDRCSTIFLVDKKGVPVRKEECVYHWGKPMKRRGIGGFETKYSCCGCDVDSAGCTVGASHVVEPTDLNSVRGFVSTLPKSPPSDGDWGVYALDCEMCYTTGGIELTRVTVIGSDCQTIYETLVKPDNPILDYNTRFSGISEEDLVGVRTSIRDVQAVLLSKFSDKTILIGHSLESDFKALKLIHKTVIDTSVVFPHKMGPPYKKALRTLSADILKKIIQNDVSGHDSAEDAITCMELMIWKVKEDLKMLR